MKLLTPLLTLLVVAAWHPRASYAQDSPIIVDDNGNVPEELYTQGAKTGKTGKQPNNAKTAHALANDAPSTHISHNDNGIKALDAKGEHSVQIPGYQAVCLTGPGIAPIYLANETPWKLTTFPNDKTFIRTDDGDNSLIHIHPGPGMRLLPNNMHLLDLGTRKQLTGARFEGAVTNSQTLTYTQNQEPPQMYTIHYCGPLPGCRDTNNINWCPDPPQAKKK
jgi:hypothetical protein